jgi:hypothetical protein
MSINLCEFCGAKPAVGRITIGLVENVSHMVCLECGDEECELEGEDWIDDEMDYVDTLYDGL